MLEQPSDTHSTSNLKLRLIQFRNDKNEQKALEAFADMGFLVKSNLNRQYVVTPIVMKILKQRGIHFLKRKANLVRKVK